MMKKILTLILVLIFAHPILGQNTPNDCVNAIVVCGNGTFSSNASGIGNIQEVSGCSGFEHNSLWIKINIVQSGTLGFDLIPDDPSVSVDYDFWVYGPNKSCGSLGSPIRCATTNPLAAGMTNNHTGLNNNPITVTGPGSNGNGYVYRLNVLAGEFYYIAIDRPVGNGGFQIQWNGTAMLNGGAFPTPPTANQIPDLKTCSNTPNVGIFDLDSVRSQINSNLTTNTINFYTTFANAIDGISPLPNIIANTSNPQTIYAKVVNNVSGCYTITDFKLRVYPVPSANIAVSNTSVCSGDNVTVTLTGTPGATVEYTVNGGAVQSALLDATGIFQFTQSITVSTTYALISAKILDGNNATVCFQTENDVATVSVLVITPNFTPITPICSGGTLSALPTISNNAITGTWSPALNNTTTTTYTFTPTTGQCAVPTTMTITVNPNTTPTFTQVAPICSGGILAALPTTSNNGIPGTWSPAINNTTTTTYTFTPTTGQCAITITMTIVVNSNGTPTFTPIASICSGSALTLSTTSTNGITGTWSPAIDNTATTTYTFTPTAGQCAVATTTMTVTVAPNVTPVFTQVTPICSGTTLAALPTTSNNGITGTWSPTINNTATTTYTFTPTIGQCGVTAMMTITVNPNVIPTFAQVASICSGGMLSALPTTSTNGITGTWSPALNNTATTTYTFTPTVGLCATNATMVITVNPNVIPTFTQVEPVCSGATIATLPNTSNNGITGTWSPTINNTATTTYTFTPSVGQCAVATTMTIIVNPNILPVFNQAASICSGGTLSALPTTSINGITGTWSPALNNTATTVYTFTPSVGQCAVTATMTITVNSNVTPTFTQVPPICSGGALSALPTTSNNGITGTWSPALNNLATTTYVFTPTTGLCATTASMTITVATVTPTFAQVAPICSGSSLSALPTTSNNGITGTWSPTLNNLTTTTYTFTPSVGQCATTSSMTIVVNSFVTPVFNQIASVCSGGNLGSLPTTSNNGITGTWSPAINNTATTTYTFTPTVGQCATATTMTIAITPKPIITVINNSPSICSGDPIDVILNCNNLPTATIHWQFQSSSATGGSSGSGIGPIHLTDLLTLNSNITVPTNVSFTVYGEGDCRGDAIQVSIIINPLPKPLITPGFICVDSNNQVLSTYTLNTGLSSANHTFIWYYNGIAIAGATGSTYTVDQISEVGLYSVEATNTVTGCTSQLFDVDVQSSYAANAATYVVSNYFEDNQTITVSVLGTGTYLYSLDGGSFQESNIFSFVSPGEHTVTIHDTNGCTDITLEHILTIGYPNFFTPNGDGYHDTWNVWSLRNQRNAEIHIFDRFGKFIKEIRPQGEGWDGTFNGQNLPATDYWFTIKYLENQQEKVFKAHFTLKR